MKKERNVEIDLLRGLAVIAMVFIHTSAYFLKIPFVNFSWNWSQFAVPVFVFCSAYLYFKKTAVTGIVGWKNFGALFIKRFTRLVIPYYIFLILYLALVYITHPQELTISTILRYATLTTSSNDLSWLVALFVYFIFLFPIVDYLAVKKHSLFIALTGLSYLVSVYLMFKPTPINFKLIMWLPWLLIVCVTWFIVHYEDTKNTLKKMLLFFTILFITTLQTKLALHQSLSQYGNKYPPNIYHLSYGLFSIVLLYLLARKKLFEIPFLKNFILFMSLYSYSIYFIHFWMVMALDKFGLVRYFNWATMFIVVMLVTVASQRGYNWVRKRSNI